MNDMSVVKNAIEALSRSRRTAGNTKDKQARKLCTYTKTKEKFEFLHKKC